ncbi:MAG TPA: hypothetical protein VKT49_17905, partial [Bryobacteraceae bacterium]|nr:hypothetical protein [Bryobacteraceae bacterium]
MQLGWSIAALVPLETLVPDEYERWRPLLRDAMLFVFSHLSQARLQAKIAEQMQLPAGTPPEQRLLRLIAKMPGLQKLGQVLARHRRLALSVRQALCQLENGMSDMTTAQVRSIITQELGPRLKAYSVVIQPRVYMEGSASAIVKFTWRKPRREPEEGVFKVLKPYVPECFAEDMNLLQGLGEYLAGQ